MKRIVSRRALLGHAGLGVTGFLGLRAVLQNPARAGELRNIAGYGDLLPDPGKLLDLPPGFQYRAFSRTGERMDDGYLVPGAHDGMAAFEGPNGTTLLVRNHEMGAASPAAAGSPFADAAQYAALEKALVYDPATTAPAAGGATNLIYDTRAHRLEKHFLSLTGTLRNCAGGPTPWGTWITCEETNLKQGQIDGNTQTVYAKDHGWVFEVQATPNPGIQAPLPIKAMGRFSHEAIAVDPRTSIVYETEDRGDSLFYRFLPAVPGRLREGGRLQALKLKNGITDARNYSGPVVSVGVELEVEWVDLEDVESPQDNLRVQGAAKGAAKFSREEGCWWGNGAVYFACTDGGPARLGQIFKYTPSPFEGTIDEAKAPGKLELFIEPNSSALFAAPDNICIAPSGDVIICEDGSGDEFVHGVTPEGEVYKIARNATNSSEFAGACFSPDGSTLFVNIQSPGITFAITGPWHRQSGSNPANAL